MRAASYSEIVQVAKVCCLVCVAGVAPHVLAKPALILLTRPVATCTLPIPHKFPFELVGLCEGVDHDYDLGFRHPLFSCTLFSTFSQSCGVTAQQRPLPITHDPLGDLSGHSCCASNVSRHIYARAMASFEHFMSSSRVVSFIGPFPLQR